MLELEHHRQFAAIGRTVKLSPFSISAPCFANGNQPIFFERLSRQFPQIFMKPGSVVGDFQICILTNLVDNVQTETNNTLLYPETDTLIQFFAHCRIFPVQVRLFHRKLMEIPLLQLRHISPGTTAKGCPHSIGRRIGFSVSPDEIIMIGIVFSLQCLFEPDMLLGTVVQHQVHNDTDASLLAFRNQFLHIFHGTEHGINGAVIRNIISVVYLRRRTDRTQPDSIDSQFLQVIQTIDDAADITNAITVGILEALRIQFVENCLFPPTTFALI